MRLQLVRSLVAVVVLVPGLACRSPGGLEGAVTASIVGSALRIENSTTSRVYYLAVERTTAALINWAPCIDHPDCPSVPAESATTIPLTEVVGFGPTSEEALVYWWVRVPGPLFGTHQPGDIKAVTAHR